MANGLSRLIADLEDWGDDVIEQAERGVTETAALWETEASSRAPVDTTALKDSIKADYGGLEATVTVGSNYAIYQEFGTGIHATGPGGSRAKKIPWSYKGADGKWYTTYGVVAQPFWFPAGDVAERYFNNYFS